MGSSKAKWIWHPEWRDEADGTSAGGFVHFHKSITVQALPTTPVQIHITADTKYRLYINSKLVSIGPVKGDEHLWFYDEIDIRPYLKEGANDINVKVLRFFYASEYATSFPRTPFGGLYINNTDANNRFGRSVQSDGSWETALDLSTRLRTDLKEDDFLHIYEDVTHVFEHITWVPAKELQFPASHGLSAPWKLSPRFIPSPRYTSQSFEAIHNLRSSVAQSMWEKTLLRSSCSDNMHVLRLLAGTSHHIELQAEHHMTAFLDFRFEIPAHAGSSTRVTYSECYEETPEFVPYIRCKGQRCDATKELIGPEDRYVFGGMEAAESLAQLKYNGNTNEEAFSPFHFRTFRFISLDIEVGQQSDLVIKGIDIMTTNYPLEVLADFDTNPEPGNDMAISELWTTSLRTLKNCMHDCYEDCPFYEQLQYAMDIRSSALFTYRVSGDDRMARQAIIQLHNSYRPSLGLTASRAPAHQYQIIPHFSLFWICMITDHFEYFGDAGFVRQFLAASDGVLETFLRRVDPRFGLICSLDSESQWDFVDWTEAWKPMGIPPAAKRTGFQSYTNMLYAYTLKRAADLLMGISRTALADEYRSRAAKIVKAITDHCFNGSFFTDGLASIGDSDKELSQHAQIWGVLCGAAKGEQARRILAESLSSADFTPTSIAMSFYTLRALSLAGGNLYNGHFHALWQPWRKQLSLGVTTWVEDSVSQRSDCHAWGSAPLYEFMAEVAGVQPAKPGWEVISFQPRVELFPYLDAIVPFNRGDRSGLARIKWRRTGEQTAVRLLIEMDEGEAVDVPVKLVLPNGKVRIVSSAKEIGLIIRNDEV